MEERVTVTRLRLASLVWMCVCVCPCGSRSPFPTAKVPPPRAKSLDHGFKATWSSTPQPAYSTCCDTSVASFKSLHTGWMPSKSVRQRLVQRAHHDAPSAGGGPSLVITNCQPLLTHR